MKALFITTETNEIPKYAESFDSIGNTSETIRFIYNVRKEQIITPPDKDIRDFALETCPDLIVYVGACSGNMPSIDCFKKLNAEVAPTVILVSDAADKPWWSLLEQYYEERAFKVMVAIDGNKEWPFHKEHITCLTPIPDQRYKPKPHKDRSIPFGFAGNIGGSHRGENGKVLGRRPLVAGMIQLGLKYRDRDKRNSFAEDTYQGCVDWMCDSRIVPNFPMTGSFDRMHVKGRVVECGFAGSLLLEQKGSPTPDWFEPGVDYLEWGSMDEAKEIVEAYKDDPEATQVFGDRLMGKVKEHHSAEKFWKRIIDRL